MAPFRRANLFANITHVSRPIENGRCLDWNIAIKSTFIAFEISDRIFVWIFKSIVIFISGFVSFFARGNNVFLYNMWLIY